MYEVKPFINREFILSRVTQQEIFEFYLPGANVQTTKPINSTLRQDTHPTVTFKWTAEGKLLMRDWAGYFFGDCFELVSSIYGNCGYIAAMHYIARDMNLADVPVPKNLPTQKRSISGIIMDEENQTSEVTIQIKVRAWNKEDVARWKKYGWAYDLIQLYKIYPVEFVWVTRSESKLIYTHHKEDPAYAYWFGPQEYKIYFPNRSTHRFISNSYSIQGYSQLPPKGQKLIITKSLKDVGPIVRTGIHAIAPQAESILFNGKTMALLFSRFKEIYTLFDFDYAGITLANKYKRTYGIQPLMLTNGRYKSVNYHAKDVAELHERHQDIAVVSDVLHNLINHAQRQHTIIRTDVT